MRPTLFLLGMLLLAPALLAPGATAIREPPQCVRDPCCFAPCEPPVGVCVDDVTDDACWRESWICVGFSYQVPQCVRHIHFAVAPPEPLL